jgi:hypothetical protein
VKTRGMGKSSGMREKCRYGIEILECADRKKVWKHDFTPFPLIYLFVRNFTKIHGKSTVYKKKCMGSL